MTPEALLADLRAEGAQQFDPVRFHYIEALAQRAAAYQGSVRQVLEGKLQAATADLRQRRAEALALAQSDTAAPTPTGTRGATLADLVRHMAEHVPHPVERSAGGAPAQPAQFVWAAAAVPTELKSVSYFRNTWSRLSAEKQVSKALEQAPRNAGPINSHVVALRALALMRDTAPDYLNRFLSYADTLLSLDPAERPAAPAAAKTPRASTKPKTKR